MSEARVPPPLVLLILNRLREFFREPEAIFWVYGFPLLMALALGIAFRNRPVERVRVDVVDSPTAQKVVEKLKVDARLETAIHDSETARVRYRDANTDLIITPLPTGPEGRWRYEYEYDNSRPESALARSMADSALLRAGNRNAPEVTDRLREEPGSRYIDFLLPGLIGANLMGGGLWGVGFVLADMRIRKLLKRYMATPMRRSDFLLSLLLSRVVFTIPEVLLLLGFGWLVFGVTIRGSVLSVILLMFVGGACFAGIGLLVASRAKKMEVVSGLMNLVMLPMYILSGVFFSSERFPEAMQPFIQALPLTALIDALRAIMLRGESLSQQGYRLLTLVLWGGISFILALRWFRWQ